MQLVKIRYFLAACQTANFSQAAKLCQVTQPALTRGIQALEQEMGGVFFRREHYRTKLTPFGQVMRAHFERIQQHTEALLEKAQHYRQTAGTTLTVGLMRGVRAEPVRKILNEYAKADPGAEISIVEGGRSALADLLLEGSLHLAVMSGPEPQHDGLKALQLYRESFAVAFALGHRFRHLRSVELAELAAERQIAETGCEIFRQFREACLATGLASAPAVESERSDWLQHFVAAGLGIALVSDATALLPGVMTRPIAGLDLSRGIELVLRDEQAIAEPAVRFLRLAGLVALPTVVELARIGGTEPRSRRGRRQAAR
jgi:LysR family transcriptional regulator, hydrogen peroxide-inducible genes activator